MRRAAKKDDNHKAIVADLERLGYVVFDVSALSGLGFDIVVYKPPEPTLKARWMPMEIKQPGHDRFDTGSEKRARARAPIPVVHSTAEALEYL